MTCRQRHIGGKDNKEVYNRESEWDQTNLVDDDWLLVAQQGLNVPQHDDHPLQPHLLVVRCAL